MRWVLMLFVILAAVMGGEARAVVGMGQVEIGKWDGSAEMVEKRADGLRVESDRAFLEDEAAGLVDGWPLALWFPGGSAVARSDCTDEALEWDGENRLTGMWRGPWKEELAQVPFESLVGEAVAGSVVWRWGYDHRSRRVQRDEPGSGGERLRTVTVFSGGTSAAEYTETAAAGSAAGSAWTVPPAATVQHVRGPDLGGGTKGLLYSLRNGLPTFNRYNGRGDVVAQSDIDGTTTWAASYQADGRRTAEAGTNIERHRANCLPKATRDAASGLVFQAAFAAGRSKEEDPTGLLNEGFRYRDMETGTFISRDPLGLVDGPNVYCYVRQNPWTMWDPEGLAPWKKIKELKDFKAIEKAYVTGTDAVSKAVGHSSKHGCATVGGRKVHLPVGVSPGDTFQLPGEIGVKYPKGVKFDEVGWADFSPYIAKGPDGNPIRVKIKMTGDRTEDFRRANEAAGYKKKLEGDKFVWHHHQDAETMELVLRVVHDSVEHTGGQAIVKAANGGKALGTIATVAMTALLPNSSFAAKHGGSRAGALAADIAETLDPTMIGGEINEGLREIYENDQLFKGRIDKWADMAEELGRY